jgi:phosphatidylserine/phosphatidylglycerophosphate/cardiolipin synthase-like enzyme
MIADGRRAFVGSQSLKRLELDKRREVGLVIRESKVVRQLEAVFAEDWARSSKAANIEPVASDQRVIVPEMRELVEA